MSEEPKPILIGEKPDVCELERARLALMNPQIIEQKREERTFEETAKPFIELTMREGIETVWDRFEMQQPPCKFCAQGLSCARCAMGPCKIIPPNRIRGVCGADADLIVARNLLDTIATGAAAHSDHGREIVLTLYGLGMGKVSDYAITDPEKLRLLAAEYGLDTSGKQDKQVAGELARAMLEEYGTLTDSLRMASRAPAATREVWKKVGIAPRGIDREVVEAMHRVQMGVAADYANTLIHGLRTSLSDGWGGSMIATEISDVLFGTPKPNESLVNVGVIKPAMVNIALHGHNPLLSEMIVRAAADPAMKALAEKHGGYGDQPRRPLLHGERAPDAQGDPERRQPLQPGTRDNDRGARGDGGRLPVHLPLPPADGELLPYPHHLYKPQVEDPGLHVLCVRARDRVPDREGNRPDGG
jgi:carbon-monoxide dehydrogenase catalytic subunit